MAINPGNTSSNAVEINIQAKDNATNTIKGTQVAIAKLKDESNLLAKSLSVTSNSLATVSTVAIATGAKLGDVATGIAGVGNATVSAITRGIATLGSLATVVGSVRESLNSPVVTSVFSVISAEAEAALNSATSLSDVLRTITPVATAFGEGFTQKLFNLDTRSTSQKVNDSIIQIADNARNSAITSIKGLFKASTPELTFNDQLLKFIGIDSDNAKATRKAQQAVGELSDSIIGFFTVLDREVSTIVTDTGFEKVFADVKTRDIFKPIIAQTGIVGALPNAIKDSLSVPLDREIGAFTSNFINSLGKGVSSNKNSSLIKVSFNDLLQNSFTDAIAISYGRRIGTQIESVFGSVQKVTNSVSSKAGALLASRIFDGVDENRAKRAKSIIGDLTDGLSGKFITAAGGDGGGLINRLLLGTAGKVVDSSLSSLLGFGINRAINTVQRDIEGRGSVVIASAFGKLFGSSKIGEAVSTSLLESGLSKQIFNYFASFLNPTILVERLKGLSGGLAKLKDGFTSANSAIDSTSINVLVKLQNIVISIPSKLAQIQPGISSLLTTLGQGLTSIDVKIIGIFEAINKAVSFAANGSVGLLSNVSKFLDSLKASSSSTGIAGFITSLQKGIEKAIQAIGFLQQKIRSISDIGLLNVLGGTENLQYFLLEIDDFTQNIGPRTQALITNIFNSATTRIGGLSSGIQNLISNVILGLDNLKQGIPGFTEGLFKGIKSGSDGVFTLIDRLRINLVVALQSASNGKGGFLDSLADSIAGARVPIRDFQASINSAIASSKNFADTLGGNLSSTITKLQGNLVAGQMQVEKFGRSLQDSFSNVLRKIIGGAPDVIPNIVIGIYDGLGRVLDSVVQNGVISDGLKNQFYEFVDTARSAINEAIPIIQSITPYLIKQGERLREFLKQNLGNIAEVAGGAFAKIFPAIKGLFDGAGTGFLAPFTRAIKGLFLETAQQSARSFASGFIGEVFNRIAPGLDMLDKAVMNVFSSLRSVASRTSQALDIFSAIPGKFAGFNEPLAVFGYFEKTIGSVVGGVSFLSERLTFFTQGLSSLQQLTQNGPFKLLIGQTVELREKLLATQASLVGTSTIFNKFTGQEIKDPTKAIQALDLPILGQIEQLRKESLELVGVTSKDLVPLYQQVASRITSIGGSLTDAKNLALDFAASLGTLNIPLAQSQQEISSILTGQIDQNSALAKSLNITNEQVNLYKSQGRLVDELRKRLEAFRAGNKLAAQSLGGLTSNIQEIFDEIGRKAGQPLLDPLLKQVSAVYKFLEQNQQQLIAYFGQFSDYMLRIGGAITDSIKIVAKSFQGLIVQAPIYLFKSLTNAVEAFNKAIQFAAQALAPVVNTLSAMLSAAFALGGPLLGLFLTTKVLSTAVSTLGNMFGAVAQLIPGLGELMFLLDLRSNGLLNQFVNLSKVLNVGAAGFLLLGKNLESIPGAVGILQQSLGPVGGLLAGIIPTISGVGIQLAGLIAIFPPIGAFLSNLLTLAPLGLTTLAGLAAGSQYFAPLAPLFAQAADGLGLYTNASTRAAVVGGQLRTVLQSVGRAVASNVITLGLLAGGVYAAFLAFDNFVLKNEAVREILSAVGQGLATLGDIVKSIFGNPFTAAIAAVALLGTTIAVGLIPPVRTLIALQLGTWTGLAATGLNALSKAVGLLGLTNLAASIASSSLGFQALSVFMTQGAVASAQFLATNGILVKTLGFLPPSLASATTGLATFTTALYTAIAPMLPVIGTIALVVAAIASIGLAVQQVKLAQGTAEVEEYGRQLENVSDQSLSLAQSLKRAGDAQAEANKKGVQLTKEQYAENARLLKQTELQRERIDREIRERQDRLQDITGDENKAVLQTQIDQLKREQDLLTRLSGDAIQTKPKEILDKGSAFEQLRIKIEGAKAAIKAPADDTALKQKSQELIEITQQQLELGAITSEEARNNLALVADNAKVEQDIRIKAQKAIIESYKSTSRVDALKAEFELINAQLAAGQLTFAENAKAIANIQNSALEDRMKNEEAAHKETMKRLQDEYDGKKLLLEQDLLSARLTADQNLGTELGDQQLAKAEEISQQLQQLEAANNQQRQDEAKRNAEANAALTQQITENQTKQYQLAKELEKQVRDGSISEEQAALRQSSEAKKAELAVQLKSTEDAYKKQKEIINQQFEQDRTTAENQLKDKFKELAKLTPGSDAYVKVAQDAIALNKKIENSQASTKQALAKADRDYLAEKTKLESQSLQASADNEKKQRDAAIKFLDTKQKEAQDILQKSQNQQLINIQKLENAGVVIKEETELLKTKATGERINNDLRLEQERLKKLESLEKPKNQQERLALDAQIRGSRLKTQDLIRQGLENEQKAYDGQISLVKANIKLESEAKETKLERQRLTLGEAAIAQQIARQKVTDLENELALETRNKQRRSAIILELEKARTAARRAGIADELNDFDNTTAQLQAGLENRYNNGQIFQSRIRTIEAQRAVERAQKEFDLEKDNVDKKYKLQLALEKAKTALLDAQIAERKELIETENQEYLNQIEEQNQAIKRQSMLYEVMASALTERNKILEAGKNLAAAAAGFIASELDVLSKVETSEYRRKQLAEIAAAIKLEALQKQQEFERQSLENQILQNKLALEREAIQNRINQATKIAEIAKQQAEIEVFKADPRNENRSGRAQLRAKELALEANQFGLVQLGLQGGLIQQQLGGQDALANIQRRSLELKQKGDQRQAEAELINALPPGRRQRAARALEQQIIEEQGFSNFQGFIDAGLSKSRGIVEKRFGITPSIDLLGAVDPELAGLLENLSPSQRAAAIGNVQSNFDKQFGGTQSLSNVSSPNPTGKPLQLLPEFQGKLTLPSPTQSGSSIVNLEKSGNLFQTGVEKLIDYLDSQKKDTRGTNYNINITSPVGNTSTSGTAKVSTLEDTLRIAKQLAGIR
jgi:phage-related protein